VPGTKVGDQNVRKREKEKERYASMTTEQRNERNRKRREKRTEKKQVSDDLEAPNASQPKGILSCIGVVYNIVRMIIFYPHMLKIVGWMFCRWHIEQW
jgi:hypothetical protein